MNFVLIKNRRINLKHCIDILFEENGGDITFYMVGGRVLEFKDVCGEDFDNLMEFMS